MFVLLCLVIVGGPVAFAVDLCTDENRELVGRVVFGEARGEPFLGQLAVAWTVVNRVNNHDFSYPNTVRGVVYQKYGSTYEYNTMGVVVDTVAWESAKKNYSATYRNAIDAATGALCGTESDPTQCALAYCAYDPCPATSDTRYAEVYNKMQIGNHYFVCQRPKQ